jgi:hypothetical protein
MCVHHMSLSLWWAFAYQKRSWIPDYDIWTTVIGNGTWHGFLFRNGPLLLGPPLSEQKVEMKNWPPNFFCVCLPALSIKSCMKNQVGPISTFHRKVAVKVGPQLFTATFRWKVEILGVEWIIMWINFKWQRNISSDDDIRTTGIRCYDDTLPAGGQ